MLPGEDFPQIQGRRRFFECVAALGMAERADLVFNLWPFLNLWDKSHIPLSFPVRGVITVSMQETSPDPSPPPPEEETGGLEPATGRMPWDRYRALRWLVVLALLVWAGLFMRHMYFQALLKANKRNALSNMAGNIKPALRIYASDNNDFFPDKKTANEAYEPADSNTAFRKLFSSGYVNDEAAFVVKGGAAKADGDTSTLARTLSRGENHYALAKGLRANSNQNLPLVWEASLSGSWDPIWDSSRKRQERGSTWPDGTVMVLRVGGHVSPMKIAPSVDDDEGPGRLAPTEEGKNLFQLYPDGDSLGPEW
jgi:hypothetical protein